MISMRTCEENKQFFISKLEKSNKEPTYGKMQKRFNAYKKIILN